MHRHLNIWPVYGSKSTEKNVKWYRLVCGNAQFYKRTKTHRTANTPRTVKQNQSILEPANLCPVIEQ